MTEKIVRTPTKASGGITPEEKIALKHHTDVWIKRILSTERTDFSKLKPAIEGLYRVSDLAIPEVILVESPLKMAFVYGTLSHLFEKNKTNVRTTIDMVLEAFSKPKSSKVNIDDHYANIAFELANKDKKVYSAINSWSENCQGGAYWASYDCYLTALRDVIGLKLPEFDNYKYWEEAAIHGTFRCMHELFCVVSDFPVLLKLDDENRPHSQDTASHKWSDGWELFHWHGVQVPGNWILDKKSLKASDAIKWSNIEQRRAACEILGWASIIEELNGVVVDDDGDPEIGVLLEVDIPDIGKEKFLKVQCGTGRSFVLPVPPTMKTALEAQSWTWDLKPKDFKVPEVRT